MTASKKLYRSHDSVFAGVCGGIAEYFDIDPVIVRILAALLAVASLGTVLFAYVMMWVILPRPADVDPGAIPCAAYVPTRQEPGVPQDFAQQAPYGQQPPQQPAADPTVPLGGATPYASYGPAGPQQWQAVPQPAPVQPGSADAPSAGAKAGVLLGLLLLGIGVAGFFGMIITNIRWWQLWPAFFMLLGMAMVLIPSKKKSFLNRFSWGVSILAVGVVALAVTTGFLAPSTISMAFANLWPALNIMAGLVIIGAALHNDFFGLAVAVCVVVCCVAALTVYAVPGPLDHITLDLQFTDPKLFDVQLLPWM